MRKQYPLRISEDLWVELNRWAEDELRSVNGQMEFILRQAVERRKRSAPHEQTQLHEKKASDEKIEN